MLGKCSKPCWSGSLCALIVQVRVAPEKSLWQLLQMENSNEGYVWEKQPALSPLSTLQYTLKYNYVPRTLSHATPPFLIL